MDVEGSDFLADGFEEAFECVFAAAAGGDAGEAGQAAVTTHRQGELASQKNWLAEAITTEGGEWDAQRSVAGLHETLHTIDEKRAWQILRDLVADEVVERVDAHRAVYRVGL